MNAPQPVSDLTFGRRRSLPLSLSFAAVVVSSPVAVGSWPLRWWLIDDHNQRTTANQLLLLSVTNPRNMSGAIEVRTTAPTFVVCVFSGVQVMLDHNVLLYYSVLSSDCLCRRPASAVLPSSTSSSSVVIASEHGNCLSTTVCDSSTLANLGVCLSPPSIDRHTLPLLLLLPCLTYILSLTHTVLPDSASSLETGAHCVRAEHTVFSAVGASPGHAGTSAIPAVALRALHSLSRLLYCLGQFSHSIYPSPSLTQWTEALTGTDCTGTGTFFPSSALVTSPNYRVAEYGLALARLGQWIGDNAPRATLSHYVDIQTFRLKGSENGSKKFK